MIPILVCSAYQWPNFDSTGDSASHFKMFDGDDDHKAFFNNFIHTFEPRHCREFTLLCA